jgi:hypothetical protein
MIYDLVKGHTTSTRSRTTEVQELHGDSWRGEIIGHGVPDGNSKTSPNAAVTCYRLLDPQSPDLNPGVEI